MNWRPRRTDLRVPAIALLALVGLIGAPATAQELDPVPDPDIRLVLTAIEGVVGPAVDPPDDDEADEAGDLDLRVLVENRGAVDLADLQVVVEVHESVGGARSVLARALDDQVVGTGTRVIERVDVRGGDDLPSGDIAGAEITIPGGQIGWRDANDVYPVEVSVLYGTEVLDSIVTAVVHLSDPEVLDRPLQTTVVWPLSAPTTRTAAGRYPQEVPAELAPGGRLDALLAAIEHHPDAPVLLAPETQLVEELSDRSDGFTLVDGTRVDGDDPAAVNAARLLERLRTVVADSSLDPVVGPYGRADVAALAAAPGDLAGMAGSAITTARLRAQALLGRAPTSSVYLSTTPLTPASLDLTTEGTHLLLPYEQVQDDIAVSEDLAVGRARRLVREPGAEPQRLATIADPQVTRIVAAAPTEAGLAVARQRLVAETALLHLTRPGEADRSLLVLPPTHWSPSVGLAPALLSSLVDSPWLDLGPPDRPSGRLPGAQLATSAATLPGTVTSALTSAREQLGALRAAMPSGLPDLDGQTVDDLDDALLRTLTPEALAAVGTDALAGIRAVRNVAESAFGEVELPEDAGVTLTSDTGEVPITLRRTRGGDIDLVVEVESGAGLLWEEDGRSQQITLPEDSSRTVAFSARAAARGTFAVTVSVWDPTHRKILDTATVSVRSTSISRTALLIVGGVVLVLLAVGARRRRAPTLEVVR